MSHLFCPVMFLPGIFLWGDGTSLNPVVLKTKNQGLFFMIE
jgi:hypothetical protein